MKKAIYSVRRVLSSLSSTMISRERGKICTDILSISYISKILFDMSIPRNRNRFVLDASSDSALMNGPIKEEILLGIVSRIKHLVTKENGYRSLE